MEITHSQYFEDWRGKNLLEDRSVPAPVLDRQDILQDDSFGTSRQGLARAGVVPSVANVVFQ